jgi:predicted kinase
MSKNKKVILTVGLPASGKSTWCKEFIRKNPQWVKIGRDDFRYMLQDKSMLDFKGESLVTKLCFETAKTAISSGYNVLIDNTHLRITYIEDAARELNEVADISYQYFDTPLEVCIERDKERERSVGEVVIKRMNEDLKKLLEIFDFQPLPKTERIKIDYSKSWDTSLPDVVISDIDGTVAHMNGKRGPFEWTKVGIDDADWSVIRMLKNWTDQGEKLIMVSGRDESCRKETEEWLTSKGIIFHNLFMRPAGDFRKDSLIKAEIYEKEIKGKYNIIMIYDDRDQVVKTWRELGLKCAQVEPGNF